MTKYEANAGSFPSIIKIEASRETNKCVFIIGKGWHGEVTEEKRLKDNSWRPIFDTWEEAHAHIISKAVKHIESLKLQLKYAHENYDKAIKIREDK
jgi:hypothetical protein